nr:F-box protein At5g49610-like [Ipomoea trifida]
MGSKFYLKQEILVEILIRATLETLDTFKVTSKESSELAAGKSWFIEKYARKTKNIIGYIVQTLERFTCSYNFVSINPSLDVPGISMECFRDGMKILASSKQGILCCRKYADRAYHYYVCKPSTGQSVELPSPRGRDTFEYIALQILKSNPFEYQIIRFSYARFSPPGNTTFICEIFQSKFWTWRQLEDLVMEQDTIFSNQPTVCIGGIVYLLTNHNTILAFDSTTETHTEFPSPIAAIEDDKNYSKERIVEYKGKLGFTCEYKFDEGAIKIMIVFKGFTYVVYVTTALYSPPLLLSNIIRPPSIQFDASGPRLAAKLQALQFRVSKNGVFFHCSPAIGKNGVLFLCIFSTAETSVGLD